MGEKIEFVKLNDQWRIVDDPLQWILSRRGKKNGWFGPWRPRSFCMTRTALLRCIQEYCGEADPVAVAFVETWPERHAPGTMKPLAQIKREAA